MELYVAEAFKQVGEAFSFEAAAELEPQVFGGRRIEFAAPVTVRGTYSFDGKGFSVEAQAETVLRSVCARCGAAFDEPYGFPVEERFIKAGAEAADSDEECYLFTGEKLNIDKAVSDNLFLHLPLVSMCRPDCKGLCPVCGADRNVRSCSCKQTEALGPFAALAALSDEE